MNNCHQVRFIALSIRTSQNQTRLSRSQTHLSIQSLIYTWMDSADIEIYIPSFRVQLEWIQMIAFKLL